jgi:site-specific DNA recombinase
MPTAAIYCRFSTDRQSDTSVEDQARLCRARAADLGLAVGVTHSDRAVSGSTLIADRPGGRALLADALAVRFDVLLVESLDRLSRDQIDQEATVRRLEHRGIRIVGVSDGYDSASGKGRKLLRGVRGMIAEAYLDDLAEKVHRGLVGQLARGFHAGGLSYGYRSTVAAVNARGEPVGHSLEIVPEQAEVVREIFDRYAAGESLQRIAADLNARGVPGPRGTWSVSALYGSPRKGSGVVNNDLYRGRHVWNRSQWVKDPDTRRRVRLIRPPEEWIVEERPELRIVADGQWDAVRERMNTPQRGGGSKGRGNRPTTLFGGLARCGCCGGAVIAINGRDYGCAARKDRGLAVCPGVVARRKQLDLALVGHVRRQLLAPEALADLERRVRARLADGQRDAAKSAAADAARRRELEGEVARLTDAIAQVGLSPALRARLEQAERELGALERARTRRPAPDVATSLRPRLRAVALDLAGRLTADVDRARGALRDLLGDVRLVRDGEAVYAEVDAIADRLLLAAGGDVSLGPVAGDCYRTRIRVG